MKNKYIKISIICGLILLLFVGLTFIKNVGAKTKHEEVVVEPPVVIEKEVRFKDSENTDIKNYVEGKMRDYNLNDNNFRFFFYNVDTGSYYYYNMDDDFVAASTIKVPMCMYYYDLIREGKMSSDATLTVQSADLEEVGDIYKNYTPGSKVPIKEVLYQVIVNSDNTGTNMLTRNSGYRNIKKGIRKYSNHQVPANWYSENVVDAQYLYDVLMYLNEHKNEYQELLKNMEMSSQGAYLKQYVDYPVAHKYGLMQGNVHDYGIIEGENKYIVGVFTTNVDGGQTLIESMGKDIVAIEEGE